MRTMNNIIHIIECNTWTDKQMVMENKTKLRGRLSSVYIEKHATKDEQRVQIANRSIGREERVKNKAVLIGSKK